MQMQLTPSVGLQRLADQRRTQMRAADANGHDRSECLARVSALPALADCRAQDAHALQNTSDLRSYIDSPDSDGFVALVAQSPVRYGPVLGDVDRLTCEQLVAQRLETALLCKIEQQRQRF